MPILHNHKFLCSVMKTLDTKTFSFVKLIKKLYSLTKFNHTIAKDKLKQVY